MKPTALPPATASPDHDTGVAELRSLIHRATAGQPGQREALERRGFGDGLLVCESSISRWVALWSAPTSPAPLL